MSLSILFLLTIIVACLVGGLVGAIALHFYLRKKILRRVSIKMLKSIGGLTVEELLTHKSELVRQYGVSLQGNPSPTLVERLWNDEDYKMSEKQFWILIWVIIGTVVLMTTLLIGVFVNLNTHLYLEAGYRQIEVPTQTSTVWVSPEQ